MVSVLSWHPLLNMRHSDLRTINDLANYLRCDVAFLERATSNEFDVLDLANGDKLKLSPSGVTVTIARIKKKGKKTGFRKVHKIWTDEFKNSLKILNNYLREIYIPKDCVQGFIKNRSIKTNADMHLGKRLLLSVDIKNFFESIKKKMIVAGLTELGFQKSIAEFISEFVTIEGSLVQGFSTSPVLANIVSSKLDLELIKFCGNSLIYSRYADDLYFSTDDNEIELDAIEKIISSHGFSLNHDKTKLMKRGQLQYVTGLTVFDSDRARISKQIKRNLRLEIYYITKFGYRRHIRVKLKKEGFDSSLEHFRLFVNEEIEATISRIFGWLNFIHSVEPDFTAKYYKTLIKIKPNYYRKLN